MTEESTVDGDQPAPDPGLARRRAERRRRLMVPHLATSEVTKRYDVGDALARRYGVPTVTVACGGEKTSTLATRRRDLVQCPDCLLTMLTPAHVADLRSCARQSVLRLPTGETRLYHDDGTYTTVNPRIGELETARLVKPGAELFAPGRRRWRYIDVTRLGDAVIAAQVDHEEREQ